jgi:indolepyruvate ferredoxin oxidoreductase
MPGIGCHYMVLWMDRGTEGFTQMGGEGANWIGEAPFSARDHVFQNLGDGTYNHSGYLADARRQGRRRQHHLQDLYNDAVADDRRAARSRGMHVEQAGRSREGAKTSRRHRRSAQLPGGTAWPPA